MDLSSIFSSFGSDPMANFQSVLNGINGIGGSLTQAGNDNRLNTGIQQNLGNNSSTIQSQIDALNGQINQNRSQAQDMYNRSLTDVTGQNQGLQGNIDTMTNNLTALSDPNSAYMQNARQAIERKDAAAGRNSQWGDRETQLAGTLAQYVSQYAPGLQNSITGARNQINQNNQGLASLYSTANAPADRNTLAQIQLLQQQLANTQSQNTNGRTSQNSAANSIFGTGGVLNSLGQVAGGLGGLFGGGSSGGTGNITDYYGNQGSVNSGITGYGSGLTNSYGNVGSLYDNNSTYGYGNLPAGDYFGGGGLGGTPTGGYLDSY